MIITAYKLTWLPSVLKAAGLKVAEQPGWQTRGHGDMGTVKGVLCHHTAGGRKGNAPSLGICINGRSDLAGPLSQLVLGRDGTFYVVAAGRCYHAGAGRWQGITAGNSEMIGIEAENTGNADEHPWSAVQMDAYERGVAAILKHIGAKPIMAVGHLEYALPVGRKPDPSFSTGTRDERIAAMNAFRERVGLIMSGTAAQENTKMAEPASIRYKNPGAMWGSPLAIKWGASKQAVTLNDGKGQGNNIAVFPTHVQGICAQLDLWRTSANYKNKRFADAIAIWSGHNEVESYIKFVIARVPGMTRNTIMDDAFWRSPNGIAFLKAQAWHEAGKPYPAPDADWIEAQRRVFGTPAIVVTTPTKQPVASPATKAAGAGAVVIAGGAAAAVQRGISAIEIIGWIGGLSAVAVTAFIIGYRIIKGTWPWTSIGKALQEPSLHSLQSSDRSLALASARLALSSADLPAVPSPQPSASRKPRKRSAKPSPRTRRPRKSSKPLKPSAARKSSPKRKSGSKS